MKTPQRMIKDATYKRLREQAHQIRLIYPAVFTVLWDYGWREKRIITVLIETVEALKEGSANGLSIFELLEKETGIEMVLDGVASYKTFPCFADTDKKILSDIQYARLIEEQIQWIPSVMLAGICVVLHRKKHWGFEKLNDFMQKVNLIRATLGEDEETYSKYMYEVTGHRSEEIWTVES